MSSFLITLLIEIVGLSVQSKDSFGDILVLANSMTSITHQMALTIPVLFKLFLHINHIVKHLN